MKEGKGWLEPVLRGWDGTASLVGRCVVEQSLVRFTLSRAASANERFDGTRTLIQIYMLRRKANELENNDRDGLDFSEHSLYKLERVRGLKEENRYITETFHIILM